MPGVRVTGTGHHELGLTWSGLLARVGWAAGADAVHDQLAGDESAATVEPDRSVVLGHHRDGEVRDACANQRAVNGRQAELFRPPIHAIAAAPRGCRAP